MKTIVVPKAEGFSCIEKFNRAQIDTVCWPDDFPYKPEVSFAIAHDGQSLLIKFFVTEDNVHAVTTVSNGPVWEDSCVEFFVKEPDSRFYFNFETNCIGVGLAAKRVSKSECTHFSEEQMATIGRHSSLACEPVDIKGSHSWSLELRIPFACICENWDGSVPKTLNANFYKCGDKTDKVHFLSWNKVETKNPDFHRPEFFGVLELEA